LALGLCGDYSSYPIHASFDAFSNAILWQLFPVLTKMTESDFLYDYLGLAIGFGITALLLTALTKAS
jgi:hypothetical protein